MMKRTNNYASRLKNLKVSGMNKKLCEMQRLKTYNRFKAF